MENEDTMSESEPLLSQHNSSSIQSLDSSRGSKRKRYGVDNFLPCDPRRWLHRFLMLGLMCLLSFGELEHCNELHI